MEWLTQLTAKDVGGVIALIVIVVSTVTYVTRFIHTFTTKLEEQGEKQDAKIAKLEAENTAKDDLIDQKNQIIYRKGNRIAFLERTLIRHDIEVPPEES